MVTLPMTNTEAIFLEGCSTQECKTSTSGWRGVTRREVTNGAFPWPQTILKQWEELHVIVSCDQSLHKLPNNYVPLLPSTFASNVGKRSTLTVSPGLEKRDMLYCNENDVCFSKVSFHLTPILLPKRFFRSHRMSGSFALNWEASFIFFVIITQSRSELFFKAVPFAMDPPYEYKADM